MSSNKISEYVKFMNIHSNNYMADEIFNKLGGEKKFDQFIETEFGDYIKSIKKNTTGYVEGDKLIKFFTGSGLNARRQNHRVDNFANCAVITKIIQKLDKLEMEFNNQIYNIVAVPGTDGGTFRRRLKSRRLKNTLVAKTGTLHHTSALAGMMNSSTKTYFGIFHQVEGWKGNVRIMQDKSLIYLWEYMEETNQIHKFKYLSKYFFPTDKELERF